MRQGNGSDLLGLKDPRSTKIGIIYVASNDDRKSVLAAILTQEKLGRKQIVIVLPENQQNKAFQHPQDFDDLKSVRRKLQAQLILIVPAGPGPSEFARQRRFSVYSSLESYTDALRTESLSIGARNKGKKDRLFGFGRKTAPLVGSTAGGAVAMVLSGKTDQSIPVLFPSSDDKIAENAPNHTPSSYADLPTYNQDQRVSHQHKDNESILPVSGADQTSSTPAVGTNDAVSPSTVTNIASVASGAAGIVAADLINKRVQHSVTSGGSSTSMDDGDALPPVSPTPSPQKSVSVSSSALNATPPPPPLPSSMPNTPDPADGTGPSIIELPSSPRAVPNRSTGKLPAVGGITAVAGTVPSLVTPLSHAPSSQQDNTGKTVAVTGAAASASPSHEVGVSHPPARDGKEMQTGARRRKRGLGGLIVAILIVVLLLLCGGVASSAAGLQLFQFNLPLVGNAAPAIVTITPDSKLEQDSYVIQAVTSNADPTQRQIASRQLTFSPQSQSKSVAATGVGHVSAQAATGQLTFYNGSDQTFVVGSTTPIPGPNGVFVETDGPATIPAGHLPTVGSVTVNAHVTTAGANGNMATGAINGTCCASGGFITVVSSAFTGGQDEKDYTFLQQSDVDGYASQLKSMLSQQALNGLKGQLKPNEQLAGDPQCPIQSSEDQPVGDQGHNVPSANITVDATCTGLAYDASAARTLAQDLLIRKAISNLGQGYALAGTILTKQTVTDVKDGVVTLQVAVTGTWYYQFNNKLKQVLLASQLANKTRVAAQGLLNAYKGVAKARIDIANGGDSLPSDPKQISIVVVAVSGVSPTNLPPLPMESHNPL